MRFGPSETDPPNRSISLYVIFFMYICMYTFSMIKMKSDTYLETVVTKSYIIIIDSTNRVGERIHDHASGKDAIFCQY